MVIDLSRYLNDVSVDTTRSIAHVGGGTSWEKLDEVCDGYGLSTVGPGMNQVGRKQTTIVVLGQKVIHFRSVWVGEYTFVPQACHPRHIDGAPST